MPIDGTYKGTAKSVLGKAECEITINQEGDVITGSATAAGITSEIQNGKIEGNHITGTVEGEGSLGHMVLEIEATIEDEKMTGTITIGRIKAKVQAERV